MRENTAPTSFFQFHQPFLGQTLDAPYGIEFLFSSYNLKDRIVIHFAGAVIIPSRLTVNDLQQSERFLLLDTLSHHDLLPFLVQYGLKQVNPVTVSFYIGLALYLGVTLSVGIRMGYNAFSWIIQVLWATVAWLVLIPFHEGIHGLVYWALGARDIRVGVSLREGVVYAIAHGFVVNRREFIGLALAPTVLINGGLAVLAWCAEPLRFFALALSVLHFSSAGGDWALLSYLWVKRAHPVFTYDDADRKMSYFYAMKKEGCLQ
ncbi:MAG TPA: DUF3267 domain-containing protein [Anaerolinea thermolimosa]|uniref:DUF3267 domain-containing protein n=1 Tax=Anaerolinea thermolimosa TaxID=229919 RepID=A0A3D1JEK4_9CHLR|nr:DUF3267 domain-containing protein [Anaerolinea thermolimosa]